MPQLPRLVLLLAVAALLGRGAGEGRGLDVDVAALVQELAAQMAALPDPGEIEVRDMTLPDGDEQREFGKGAGIYITPGEAVVVRAKTIVEQGPTDGLEVLACLKGGKNHEALMYLGTENGQLLKAAFVVALDLADGVAAPEASGLPARGTPVSVDLCWVEDPLLDPDAMVGTAASSLVRDRLTDHAYPALPYVYTGSQIQRVQVQVPGEDPVEKELFMLDSTRSLAVNFDEPDALFASPFPLAAKDDTFEANSRLAPQAGTAVYLVFRPCELPLTLAMNAAGELHHDGEALAEGQLRDLLAERFGPDAEVAERAVGVEVAAEVDRNHDIAARSRILDAAIAADVWVAPVFVLADE